MIPCNSLGCCVGRKCLILPHPPLGCAAPQESFLPAEVIPGCVMLSPAVSPLALVTAWVTPRPRCTPGDSAALGIPEGFARLGAQRTPGPPFLGLRRWDSLLKMGTVQNPPCCPLRGEIVRENSSQLQGLICCPDEETLIT